MFETFIACVRMPISPSPAPSAATALASGSAVAPRVRKTISRMISAAMKPNANGGTPPLLWPMFWNALPVNSTCKLSLRSVFRSLKTSVNSFWS